ncbi:MAG: hypothetical protein NT145_08020 [Elusimicrobia bacterium]|nr:hypothetical protein [Elusimicrobiota bacterium]
MGKKHFLYYFLIPCLAIFSACDKNPADKILNPTTIVTAASWSGPYVIYDQELRTGGDVVFFTSQEGQTLDFSCYERPADGSKCLKFSWDGSEVTDYNSGNVRTFQWVGIGLAVKDSNNQDSPSTKDMTPGGYTKLSFKIRGSLNASVAFQMKFEANSTTTNIYTSSLADHDWHTVEFPVSGSLAAGIKYYVILSFQYFGSTKGNGGTVYLDDIQFLK